MTLISKYLKSQTITKLKSIANPKFQKVVPNTAKEIYAWNKKILSFSKKSKYCKQEIYKNDHIIDIRVNTEMLTTGLVIPSGTKRPPAVASTQWCKYQANNLLRQTRVSSTLGSSLTLISKYLKSQTITKLKSIEDPKFQTVVPNTA